MVFLSPPHKGPGLNWWESREEMVGSWNCPAGKCWLGWRPLDDRPAKGWRAPERAMQRFGKEVHLLLFCWPEFLIEAN